MKGNQSFYTRYKDMQDGYEEYKTTKYYTGPSVTNIS